MALLFPWATKEYLLWKMTLGQILFYHNKAISIKNGKQENGPSLLDKTFDELKAIKEEAIKQAEIDKAEMKRKYGDI